jgi:hypothetical protein
LPKRADATMDLLDALMTISHVESPVALSESVLFRRGFASVYDVLEEGEFPEATLREIFSQSQPADGETIAGYEGSSLYCTPNLSPEADILEESEKASGQVGEKFSWLARLVKPGTSWVAPQDIQQSEHPCSDIEQGCLIYTRRKDHEPSITYHANDARRKSGALYRCQ